MGWVVSMARQSFYHDPARKNIEVFQDFGQGLNTESSNDNISDREFADVINMDIKERGSLERRTGYSKEFTPSGDAIGIFDFSRTTEAYGVEGEKILEGEAVFSDVGVRLEEPTQNEMADHYHDIRAWNHYGNTARRELVTDITPPIEGAAVYKVTLANDIDREPYLASNARQDMGITTLSLYVMPINHNIIRLGIRDQFGTGFGDPSNDSQFTIPYGEWTRVWNTSDLREMNEPIAQRIFGGYGYVAPAYQEFYVCAIQLEDTDYPTSYINNYRAGEAMAVDSVTLNEQEGTIEGEFMIPYVSEVVPKYYPILTTGFEERSRFLIMVDSGTNQLKVWHGDGSKEITLQSKTVIKPNVLYKFAYSWGQRRLTLYLDGEVEHYRNTQYYNIDGLYKSSAVLLGRWNQGFTGFNTSYLNGFIRKLRFSRVVRSDEYVAEGITNSVDEHNTLYADFTMASLAFSYYNNLKPQGFFRFYRGNQDYDNILVAGGVFYINGVETPVQGGFITQSERPMEAIQWHEQLYIATGNGLVEYSENKDTKEMELKLINPYVPDSLEALYIGTNGLMQDPNNFVDDIIDGNIVGISGIQFSKRYGIQNEWLSVSAYAIKPEYEQNVEWKFERRKASWKDDEWFVGRDWSQSNMYTFSTDWTGEMIFKISIRKLGETLTLDEFIVPNYIVKPAEDAEDEEIPHDSINTCNKILLHWDRLVMYGDTHIEDAIYVSHLHNPAYFPMSNTLQFENPKREGITKILRHRDNLVIFTETSIQALYGKDPTPYSDDGYNRIMLNTDVGCIAPNSAQVVGNHIYFLSYEGLYALKSLGNHESRVNVEPIDALVKSEVLLDTNASAINVDNQYHLVYPDRGKRMRFYPQRNIWTKDYHSGSFDFERMYFYDGEWFAQGFDGKLIKEDKTVKIDGEDEYTSEYTSKYMDFGEKYAAKKLRECHFMLMSTEPIDVEVETWIDEEMISSDVIRVTPEQEKYNIRTAGRGFLVRTVIRYTGSADFRIIGYGFVFKLKKP